MKKVSVIVPVYKVEKYIADTIHSVLAQTYQDFELLIIDDGSPDKSIEICQQFTDSRIKILRQANQGASGARNTGICHAQGEYIAFLDGDDLWLPEKLEKHIAHLESSPRVGVSFSRSIYIDAAGNFLNSYQMPKLKEITPQYLLQCNPIGNGSAPVIRREVFAAIKFQDYFAGLQEDCYFDLKLQRAEDAECWLRIALQTSWQIQGIPEALTIYRVNPEGLSANLVKHFEAWEKVIDKTSSYAPEMFTQSIKPTKAYKLQYLARSAIRLQVGADAVKFIHRAVLTYWRILLEQPRRTLLTWVAAYALWILPLPIYEQIEKLALKITGAIQRSLIVQDLLRRELV